MVAGGQKNKGSQWEREVARTLSMWLYDDPNVLIRSGGLGPTATKRGDFLALNDLVQLKRFHEPFPFVVECKFYRQPLEVTQFWSDASLFWAAWRQCVDEAKTTPDRIPLLVWKSNRRPPLVASWRGLLPRANHASLVLATEEGSDVRVMDLKAFLATAREHAIEISKRLHRRNAADAPVGEA